MNKIQRLEKMEADIAILKAEIKADARKENKDWTTDVRQANGRKEYSIDGDETLCVFESSKAAGCNGECYEKTQKYGHPIAYVGCDYTKIIDEKGNIVHGYLWIDRD